MQADNGRNAVVFHFRVHRIYLATVAIIAVMLVSRSYFHQGWSPRLVQIAGMADFILIAISFAVYLLIARLAAPVSTLSRLNAIVHAGLALLAMTVAILSQALFLKTGELLNFDMLAFFVDHLGDLKDVASGSMDNELLAMLALSLAVLVLAMLRFSSKALIVLQFVTLLLPVSLVFASPLLQPEKLDGKIDLPTHVKDKQLYRGRYMAMGAEHFEWNSIAAAAWRRGILTGMQISSYGVSALHALAKDVDVQPAYDAPRLATAAEEVAVKHPNVLLVVLESFRYDALASYQGSSTRKPANTPFLDQIAQSGWRVERAYTTIPHTSKALVGIYCGTFARMETSISEALPGNLPLNCLPGLLKEAGFRSAHFQTAVGTFEDRVPFLRNVGFDEQFTQESFGNDGREWTKLGYLGVDDRAMIDPAIAWMSLQRKERRPFFASMLTISTHHPYVIPKNIQSVEDPKQAKQAYDLAVRYTDDWLRELFEKMKDSGLLDNTLVVITGDHGEAFSEHGLIGHNAAGYEEGMRVPLILYGPMLGQPKVVSGLRQHIDIMPTVLDLAGVAYSGKLPGGSLREDVSGHADLMTSCFYTNYCLTHLSDDGMKVIYFYGKRGIEMYDLKADPSEEKNLYDADSHDDAFRRLSFAAKKKAAFTSVYRPDASR